MGIALAWLAITLFIGIPITCLGGWSLYGLLSHSNVRLDDAEHILWLAGSSFALLFGLFICAQAALGVRRTFS